MEGSNDSTTDFTTDSATTLPRDMEGSGDIISDFTTGTAVARETLEISDMEGAKDTIDSTIGSNTTTARETTSVENLLLGWSGENNFRQEI